MRSIKQSGKDPASDIAFLENSIYYFIKCAFIKQEANGFRLVVTHQERLLLDRLYPNKKAAKIGFARRYGYRLWRKGVRPVWTSAPPPLNCCSFIAREIPPRYFKIL